MRRLALVALAATAAVGFAQTPKKDAPKPAPSAPASLSELNERFDREAEAAEKKVKSDRLAALEAYVADKKTGMNADALEARLAAASLAQDLEKWDVVKTHAEKVVADAKDEKQAATKTSAQVMAGRAAAKLGAKPDVVKAALGGVVAAADPAKQYTLQAAFDATNALVDYLVDHDDKEGAIKAWDALTEKIPDEGLAQMAKAEIESIKLIGETPTAFPADAKDTAGKALSLADYKGKVLLVDFWATWCGPCMREMPNVVDAYKKYGAKGFEIVGISLDNEKSIEKMADVMKDKNMTWRQFADGKGWQNEIAQLYGVQSIPATYLLDREGKVRKVGVRGKDLHAMIEKLLGEAPKDAPKK